jgi:transcriptional regulator with XRE-family HTH domain
MIKVMRKPIEFGNFIHDLRKEKKYSLKIVADKLGVDISLLSKIENGDRQLQRRMLKGLSAIFEIDYKKLHIDYLLFRIKNEFGQEPFLKEVIIELSKELK